MLPRSFLYVPAHKPDLFMKAATGAADAIVLDLEDAVPAASKSVARDEVRRWLSSDPDVTAELWARVSPTALDDDLAAVLHPRLDGLLLADVSLDALDRCRSAIAASPHRWSSSEAAPAGERPSRPPQPPSDPAPDTLRIVGLVESAAALVTLRQLATHPALTSFGIGEVDLLGDLRITRTPATESAITHLRTQVVLHSAAAGLEPPVAPTSTDFRDLDAFAASTRLALDLGFRSRTAIHPAQVPVVHDVLTPSPEEIDTARDVVRRFEEASSGGTVGADGRFIDAAVVRAARETLSRVP